MFAQKKLFLGQSPTAAAAAVYIEDVFSTYLYTGNSTSGGTQTITNDIDLSTKGGMVWIKGRSAASNNILTDTARGAGTSATANKAISSNLSDAENLGGTAYDYLSAFNADGFTVTQGGTTTATRGANYNAVTYSSWTFRKQAKFFDVVSFSESGTSTTTVSHSLGATPGCIIIKRTSASEPWYGVYHRSLTSTNYYLTFSSTAAAADYGSAWITVTSTNFTIDNAFFGGTSQTFVAYLFAHDAGGFGAAGTDNVISCGSFTHNGTSTSVNLGYEPQWMIIKRTDAVGAWELYDNMRGFGVGSVLTYLYPNYEFAETTNSRGGVTATGVTWNSGLSAGTYIYIAIRRGPMRTPTSGTSVFNPVVYTGTNVDNRLVDMSLLTDMAFVRQRNDTVLGGMVVGDRLRGDPYLLTGTIDAEVSDADSFMTPTAGYGNSWSAMNGFGVGNDATSKLNASTTSNNQIAEGFRRAPGFFDVVCYTGTGANATVNHNLGVAPELMLIKRRNQVAAWAAYAGNASTYLVVNTTANATTNATFWNNTAPTATVFSVGSNVTVNGNGNTFVSYLFASCPGVSKVGSYTGSGTTKQIDCGFTNGSRFVMIKRTDSTGDWYVWDSARGIVAGDDPYLLLNSTAAEVTNTDYVDTYSAGFEISSTAPANVNASNATFIFLAIA